MLIPDDSYVTVAEADEWHGKRATAQYWNSLTDAQKETQLITASDYIDSLELCGTVTQKGQPREFPRNGETEVPRKIKTAIMWLSGQATLTASSDNTEAPIIKKKVDVIEITYSDKVNEALATATNGRYQYLDSMLAEFICHNNTEESPPYIGAILVSGYRAGGCC